MGQTGNQRQSATPDYGCDVKIAELNVPSRAKKVLYSLGIETVEDCATLSVGRLLKIKHCGRKTANKIKWALEDQGLAVGNPPIDRLFLSPRAEHALDALGFRTLQDCAGLTMTRLLQVKNCGTGTAVEIKQVLQGHGIDIGDPPKKLKSVRCDACGRHHYCSGNR